MTLNIVIGLLLILTGILLSKFPKLLAGYTEQLEDPRSKYDTQKISRTVLLILTMAGLLVVSTFFITSHYGLDRHNIPAILAIVVFAIYGLYMSIESMKKP